MSLYMLYIWGWNIIYDFEVVYVNVVVSSCLFLAAVTCLYMYTTFIRDE